MKAILISVEPKLAPVIPADWTRAPGDPGGWLDARGAPTGAGDLPTAPTGKWRATYEVLHADGRRTHQRFTVVGADRLEINAAVKAELSRHAAATPAIPSAPELAQEIEA